MENDPQLRDVLHGWKVDAALPPRFQEGVWKRLETVGAPTATRIWGEWLAALFARPAFAAVLATLMLVGGLTAGYWRAERDTARWDNELAQRYVASIDPYLGLR